MSFDVFGLREEVVGEYRDYVTSFINILDDQIDSFVKKELMEPRGVWSYSCYSIACDTGRLRRSRCKNMNVGTISSMSSDNIR